MKPLKVNPEYKELVPRLTDEEYAALETSILHYQRAFEPIKINKKDEILDGHTRFEICTKYSLYFDTQVMDFPTVNDEKIYIIEANLERRQLNDFNKTELYAKLEPLYTERSKEDKEKQRNPETGKFEPLCSNEHDGKKGKARDKVAKLAGVSPTTYHRAKTVLEKGSPETIQKARDGKISITRAYMGVTQKERHINPPPLPEGVFSVIYADPPWEYYNDLRGTPGNHYNTMSIDDIKALKVPIADDAVLFLWATNPHLHNALHVMDAWGFTYLTNFAWVKDKIGTGYWGREKHELLLIGRKGSIPPPSEDTRQATVFEFPRGTHSSKPPEFRNIIMKMLPNRQYLELFARGEAPEGWVFWGDEI